MIRVGFTGTRKGMTVEQTIKVAELLRGMNPQPGGLFRHGDCVGADCEAHNIARSLDYRICVHPPDNPKNRAFCCGDEMWPEKPYMVRNCDIVDNCDRMVACPKLAYEELRSGTWHAIRYAKRIGRMMYVVWPNGMMTILHQTP